MMRLERTGTAAVLGGSIAKIGSQFVLGLRATDCRTGRPFDEQQIQVAQKEDVLHALTKMAREFRSRSGESLANLAAHDKPLAVEIDPNFAIAYAYLGRLYGDIGDLDLSADNIAKTYELRDHASDAEKYFIAAQYQIVVTGNMEKVDQTCEGWALTYPREKGPHGFRGGMIYPVLGKFQEGVEESRKLLALDPDLPVGYTILAANYAFLNELDGAEKTLDEASGRGLDIPEYRIQRHDLAFLKGNSAEMARQIALARKQPGAEDWIEDRRAFALAYAGRLTEAQRTLQQAMQLAQATNHRERAAQFQLRGLSGKHSSGRSIRRGSFRTCLGVRLRFVLLFAIGTASIRRGKEQILIAISVYRTLKRLPIHIFGEG